jgi:hypothetical protein
MDCLLSRTKFLYGLAITGENKRQRFQVRDRAAKTVPLGTIQPQRNRYHRRDQNGGTS